MQTKIENITKSEIQGMDVEALHVLRNRFIQMNEKWWGSEFWPDCTEEVALQKYRLLMDEFAERELIFLPKEIDRALFGVIAKEISESEPVDISKPYPNFHACSLRDSGDFQDDTIRTTKRKHDGKEYSVLMGKLEGATSMTEQSYRYDKDTWDEEDARTHCKDHEGKFEAAKEVEKTDNGHQQKPFSKFCKFVAVTKAEENPEHFVMSVVYEPDVKDTQDDWATADEIRKAAWSFMESDQVYKINHDEEGEVHVLESYLSPVDFDAEGQHITAGTWLLGSRIMNDETWEKIEKGEYKGYSMAGDTLVVFE
jgi:hypothetical protein